MTLRRAKKELAQQNRILEEKVRERTEEISYTQDVIIYALTSLAETRDNETGSHIIRTQHYVKCLAEMIRSLPEYIDELDDDAVIEALFKTAPLHDVGKVGIPDSVLLKPGKLINTNAIRILEINGYPESLTTEARGLVEHLKSK